MRFASILWAGIILACATRAAEIVVGGDQGWVVTTYEPITASVGDELVFNWSPGMHNVWSMPSGDCDFSADGAMEEAAADAGTWRTTLDTEGDYWFACQVGSHCANGMMVKVTVTGGDAASACPMPPTDTVEMPEGYYPYMTWDIEGLLEYTCDGSAYSLTSVTANLSDAENGTHTGYSYSTLGDQPGVLLPTVLHTSPDNSTILGSLKSSNEDAVYVPSATSESGMDVRLTATDQEGDLEPVMYIVTGNATGGAMPTDCDEEGATMQVPYTAYLILYACEM